jgi:ATP-dependent 26S proteasome regulatory subunit
VRYNIAKLVTGKEYHTIRCHKMDSFITGLLNSINERRGQNMSSRVRGNQLISVLNRKRGREGNRADLLNKVKNEIMGERDEGDAPRPFYAIDDEPMNDESMGNEVYISDLIKTNFEEEIKIDFIPGIDLRIMCRVLGVSAVNGLKEHTYKEPPFITYLVMQSMQGYMESEGYTLAGELNFNHEGVTIPTQKQVWNVKDDEISFTNNGYLYYEKINSENKNDNVVFLNFSDKHQCVSQISCFTNDEKISEQHMLKLIEFSKFHNCIRGSKIKDINIFDAGFEEVKLSPNHTWDNYYFPDKVKKIFEEEIFGFLNNTEEYNKYRITRRGYVLFGQPGCGKTTAGYIICNNLPGFTVIWVTPDLIQENRQNSVSSIKLLYKLADFVTPCVIILEDLDLFAEERDVSRDSLALGGLMNLLDGVNSINNTITIGTTNRLETMESALRNRPGRFDRIIEIPPLDDVLRQKMFKNRLKEWKYDEEVINRLVEETDGWTGAEIQEFINTLHLKYINNKKIGKSLTCGIVEEVIEKMAEFGIQKSGKWGFGKRKVD